MEPIPLEQNLNWWWYKAKSHLLRHILRNLRNTRYILEIGPGLGNNLKQLSSMGTLDLLETEENFIKHINNSHLKSLVNNIYSDLDEISLKYDLIIMLDVLEHIEESQKFMNKINNILEENGSIVLGVPAYQSLWSIHDEKLKHFRRYNWKTIYTDCKSYEVVKRYGLNYLLLPIRYIQIKTNKVTTTNESGKIVSSILSLFVGIEALLRKIGLNPKFGISLYTVLKKKRN